MRLSISYSSVNHRSGSRHHGAGPFLASALSLIAAVLAALAFRLSPTLAASDDAAQLTGTIVIPRESALVGLNLGSGVELPIPVPGSEAIADVAANGQRIAVSRLARRPDGALGRNIVVLHRDGGTPELVIEHESPRIFLGSPVLSSDGQSVVFDRQDPSRPPSEARVEEASLTDGARRILAQRGRFPTINADGSSVAFVRWGTIEQLVVRSLRTETESAIVANEGFLAIASPRFSPDGEWIAFAAVGESMAWQRQLWLGAPWRGTSLSRPVRHGFPWEIWRVRPDGSDLQRITELGEDEPSVAWSPDGRAIAVYGGLGLTIVNPAGTTPPRQLGSGGFGAIGWLNPQ